MRIPSRRGPLLVAAAVAALGLVIAGVPDAVALASGPSHRTTHSDPPMYNISVRADDGNGVALATRLNNQGYQIVSRIGATVRVLGTSQTASMLRGVTGATVTGRAFAAPQGAIPAAPANQNSILPKKLHGKHYQTYYGGYRTVAAYEQFEDDLVTAYPNLVQHITYGTSFTGDNSLNAICITANAQHGCKLQPNVPKARFLLMAQIHAREIATSEMAWRYITELIDGYKHDAQITSLLDSTEIWVVPQVNPDGIVTVQNGIEQEGTGSDSPAYQRKNMDEDQTPAGGCGSDWEFEQPGVDLNRNFDSHFGGQGTSEDPCDQEFLGTAPDSETESADLSALFKKLFRDQRGKGPKAMAPLTTTGAMVTLHTVAGLVLLPWSYDDTVQAPNDAGLRSMAFRQSYYNGYDTGQSGQVLYNAAGTTDDWTYQTLGIASFTWELDGTGACEGTFLPTYSCMDAYASNNLPGLLYDAAAAREPYSLSLGPTILSASASASAGTATVTASADDAAYGANGVGRPAAQNVTQARIFVGKAPWAKGASSSPMTIQGSGTSVMATANVTQTATKTMAWVQAMDSDGNWGPAVAVWIPAAG